MQAEKALKSQNVPYRSVSTAEIEAEFHFKKLPTNYLGLLQPDGASIDLKAIMQTLYNWDVESPFVTLKHEAPVSNIAQKHGKFSITTPLGTFIAEKIVLTPGPYVNNAFNLLHFDTEHPPQLVNQ